MFGCHSREKPALSEAEGATLKKYKSIKWR